MSAARADLKHRYSFDEFPGSTEAGDFYNGSNATLFGGADFTGTGSIAFNGTSAYAELPNGVISALTNATFETWITWNAGAGNWQRVFDFGNSTTGEGTAGIGTNYIFLTPRSAGGVALFGARASDSLSDNVALSYPTALPTNTQVHIAVTYDISNAVAKMYVNGAYVGQRTATQALSSIQDVNNWLGRSQYTNDAFFAGSMQEFRIYDNALTAPQIAANAAAGPENDMADPGAVLAARLSAPAVVFTFGTAQATVFADFANAANVNVTYEGALFQSSDSNVLTVASDGTIRALSNGTATITAVYQDITNSQPVQVVYPYVNVVKHRYSFDSGPNIVDYVSGSNGILIDAAARSSFSGGQLILSNLPSTASSAAGAYVDLPNGIVSALTNATFETWVTFQAAGGNWQRIFDFGNNSAGEGNAGNGLSYILLSPRTGGSGGTRVAVRNGTTETLNLDAPQLGTRVEAHVVVTYSTNLGSRIYVNGILVQAKAATTPLSTLVDVNNWLGRSQWGGDHYFNGKYNEFRIYNGLLSDGDVRASYLAGPDTVTNAGQLQSIALQLPQPTTSGGAQLPRVLASYQNLTGFNVTTLPDTTLTSSDTNVAVILAGNVIQAIAPGIATITATYQGAQSSAVLTVTSSPTPPLLANRYSFSEGAGTNIIDSVGGQNGVIVGTNYIWTGTNLWFNNVGTGTGSNAFVDLPNRLVSRHTNITVETWVTWAGNFTANWQRIMDFGDATTGVEGASGNGRNYLLLTPRSGATGNRIRATMSTNGNAGERVMEAGFTMAQNTETHLAIVYNGSGGAMTLYVNGVRVGAAATEVPLRHLNDINNWLGRAQWAADPFFNGRYNEFRIYNGAFSDQQVAASFTAGPDADIQVAAAIVTQPRSITVGEGADATFSVVAKGFPTLTYQWYRDSQLVLNATNATYTLPAVTVGQSGAQIHVVVSNNVSGVPTTVASSPVTLTVVNAADSLAHRYSFTSDASDGVGTAHGTLNGAAVITNGAVALNGTVGTFVNLPPGLLNGLNAVTFEFWATYGMNANWTRVFDFGMTNGAAGMNYVFFSPRTDAGAHRLAITDGPGGNENVVNGPGILDNRSVHVACVVDSSNGIIAIYTNGVFEGANTSVIRQLSTVSNLLSYIGRSLYASDGWLNANIDEFRIYNSALSAAKVLQSYQQGPAVALNNEPITIAQQPANIVVAPGANATFTVNAVRAFNGSPLTYQWRFGGEELLDETNATLTIVGASGANVGNYDVVITNNSGSLTSSIATLVLNNAPVAGIDAVFTATNTTLVFAATNLLANDSDPDSHAISVAAVSATSTNGATVVFTNGVIAYTPVAGYAGADAFTYTLSDTPGSTATGTVTVQVLAEHPGGSGMTVSFSNGTAALTFRGIPDAKYDVQRTETLPGGWTTIGTAMANSNGEIVFSDPNAPTGQAFYRLQKQ